MGIGIIALAGLIIAAGMITSPRNTLPEMDPQEWKTIWANDPPQFGEGWGNPTLLEVNLNDWGDSIWVTPTGERIYFMWIEGDPFSSIFLGKGAITTDPDVYYSDEPFVEKHVDTRFYLTEKYYGAAGPMIDAEGNYWYMSVRDYINDGKTDTDIFRNFERLPFNTDAQHTNPHYCVAKDELWFDLDDHQIMVLEKAKENGFNGVPVDAPEPINTPGDEVKESQPWLSSDCNTMYFTSGRLGTLGIFKSTRNESNEWSEPIPIIYGTKYGVGEPSLTNDGKEGSRLFYEQILRNEDTSVFTTVFFYIEKIA